MFSRSTGESRRRRCQAANDRESLFRSLEDLNADLALVLFDASDLRDPLHGAGFWLKQLNTDNLVVRSANQLSIAERSTAKGFPIILVAAQTDRGTCTLTPEELSTYCQKHGILGPVVTSAATTFGLIQSLYQLAPNHPAVADLHQSLRGPEMRQGGSVPRAAGPQPMQVAKCRRVSPRL